KTRWRRVDRNPPSEVIMENTSSTTAVKRSRKAATHVSTVAARKRSRAPRPAAEASNGSRLVVVPQGEVRADQPDLSAAATPEVVDARASIANEKLSGQFALGRPGDFVPGDLIDTAKLVARQARRKPGAVLRATVGFAGDLLRIAGGESTLAADT